MRESESEKESARDEWASERDEWQLERECESERWIRISARRGRDKFNLTNTTLIFQKIDVNMSLLTSAFGKTDVNMNLLTSVFKKLILTN